MGKQASNIQIHRPIEEHISHVNIYQVKITLKETASVHNKTVHCST